MWMVSQKIVHGLTIRNYRIEFPVKVNEFILLEDCYWNLKEVGVFCKMDLETYKAIHVKFEEVSFNFFSSGKGILYFSSEVISVEEANEILNKFLFVFVRPFIKVKS